MIYNFFEKQFPTKIAYRNFIFIPLFLAFYVVLKIFEPSGFLLEHFNGRPISQATSEAVDIGKRVKLFYKGIGLAVILILLFTRIVIFLRQFTNENELKIANGISLAGFCLLLFQLTGAAMIPSIHFIFALLLICISGIIFRQFKKNENDDFIAAFTWTILVSLSLFFLQWQFCLFAFGKNFISIPVFITLTGIPLYILFTGAFRLNMRILKISEPLHLIPLLSFISAELYMIFNQHGIYFSPKIIYAVGLFLIALKCLLLSRKTVDSFPKKSLLESIFRYRMPLVLAGIACIAFYRPVVQPEIDWFEDANHVLPLQQWFTFGKIPFLDSFSSHTLSDYGFGILYSIFNGADPMGVFVYRFMMGVFIVLILYFFIYKITGDGFLATWITIAYPYSDFLIPSYYNLVPVSVLAYILIYEKQTSLRYFFFFCSVFLMPLWRIDLGISTLIAGLTGIIFLIFFIPSFNTDWKKLIRGFAGAAGILLVLVVYAFIHSGKHVFVALKDALGYMSSFQSYGLKDLAPAADINYYSLYFIFPVAVLLISIYIIFNMIRNENPGKKNTIYSLAIVFLAIFYFSNLQRGLVRHTLTEQWDTALTSYGFFIIVSAVFIKFLDKNPFLRFFAFFIAGTFLVSNYVYTSPDLKLNNYYSYIVSEVNAPSSIPYSKEKINRIPENNAGKEYYEELFSWLNKNIPDTATFLDFSNSPMLYYYTKRIVPNYFSQIPHTAHNEYLQKRFIDDLANYNVPAVVFSNVPDNFWDYLDGIPNTIRHYRISEFIYRNYKPAYTVSHHCLWIKKNMPVNDALLVDTISMNATMANGISVQPDNSFYAFNEHGNLIYSFRKPLTFNNQKLFLTMNLSASLNGDLIVQYKSPSGNFNDKQKSACKIYGGTNNICVLMDPLPNETSISDIRFSLPEGNRIIFSTVNIYSSEYYPEKFSEEPKEYSLKWIPYIWGNYDENFKAGRISSLQKIIFKDANFEADKLKKISFTPVKNKENGNYIKMNARVVSGKQTNVTLSYGMNDEKNGSFIFTLKNDTLFHDYLVRISCQYNWYCKDNSWITLFPSGNNIEFNSIEILNGD